MRDNKKRGEKMYYISDSEYILFPLHICNKIYYYFSTDLKINQLGYSISDKKARNDIYE